MVQNIFLMGSCRIHRLFNCDKIYNNNELDKYNLLDTLWFGDNFLGSIYCSKYILMVLQILLNNDINNKDKICIIPPQLELDDNRFITICNRLKQSDIVIIEIASLKYYKLLNSEYYINREYITNRFCGDNTNNTYTMHTLTQDELANVISDIKMLLNKHNKEVLFVSHFNHANIINRDIIIKTLSKNCNYYFNPTDIILTDPEKYLLDDNHYSDLGEQIIMKELDKYLFKIYNDKVNMMQYYDDNQYEIKLYDKDNSAFFYVYEGNEDCVSYQIKNGNIWEKDLSLFLEHNLKYDDIVLEAGTHIGSHTVKICKYCKYVYGFEPFPLSYNLVTKNLALNGLSNYEIIPCALSDYNKTINIEFHSPLARNVGGWGLQFENNEEEGIIKVKCITIDSLNLDKLDLIKLDVEGSEKDVLLGGLNTIVKYKPLIIFEDWSEYPIIDINKTILKFNFLIEIGYDITYLNGSKTDCNHCPDFVARYIR